MGRITILVSRVFLGLVLIYLGGIKAADPVDFLKLVQPFGLLHGPALNVVAAVLPWAEIFCGGLLVVGFKVRGTALLQFLLLAVFTGIVLARAIALARAGTPFCSIRFDCGCGTGEVLICAKLVENAALMFLAAIVVRFTPVSQRYEAVGDP